jgi:hypothetical protein
MSWDFPTNVAKLTTMRSAKINMQLSEMNVEHATLQSDMQDRQLENDFTKAQADYQSALAVYSLESVSYNHVMNQYVNDIIPLDRLLTAQVKLLSSRLNVASALQRFLIQVQKFKSTINSNEINRNIFGLSDVRISSCFMRQKQGY